MTAVTWTPWRRLQAEARKEAIWQAYTETLRELRLGIAPPADADDWVAAKRHRQRERAVRQDARLVTAQRFGITPERVKQIVGKA